VLNLPPHIAARLRLLRTRAALPAWVFTGLAAFDLIADVVGGARVVWQSVQEIPAVGWLASPTGLVLLALGWVAWLLIRPAEALKRVERLEHMRIVLRQAASELRAAALHPSGSNEAIGASYRFMQILELLDDAFVAKVRLDYDAFLERERRMYKAAGVDYSPFSLAADFIDRVAAHVTVDDLDPGFRVPASFAEWRAGHQPNIRPVLWSK
jgi:hypothetical protein